MTTSGVQAARSRAPQEPGGATGSTTGDATDGTTGGPREDRRSTRWEAHRRARREELVDAALRAITRHGPGVGMEEIAATAGTSKTVLYRHFADKEQLYLAVAGRVDRRIVGELRRAISATSDPRAALAAAVATYLRLVEDDPRVYRFVVSRPGVDRLGTDPVTGLTAAISAELARLIAAQLPPDHHRAPATSAWAHGLVGMVRAAADHWASTPGRPSAAVLAEQLTDLAWGGLSAVIAPRTTSTTGRTSTGTRTSTQLEEEQA